MSAVAKQALYLALLVTLTACNDAKPPVVEPQAKLELEPKVDVVAPPAVIEEKANVLPYLDAKPQAAQFVLPKCSGKNCLKLELESLTTQDPWLNTWLTACQAQVLMQQIDQEQANLSLQQAVNRYAKASDAWKKLHTANTAFQLQLTTEIAYQKNGIVLLKILVNSHQVDTKVKDRLYFFVADRHAQQALTLKDVIAADYAKTLQDIVNQDYKKWLNTQTDEVQSAAPKQLAWQQGEWFYDVEGIGIHFRAGQLSPTAEQLDIYLTAAQTKRVLNAALYQTLFNPKSPREETHETKNRAA